MDKTDVWELVEQARSQVVDADDVDAVAQRMAELLATHQPDQIAAFDRPLSDLVAESYLAPLWAAAYVINGGASDDGFDYFRGWLIGQGRGVYERALADPDSLADVPAVVEAADEDDVLESEDMLSVAWDAYEAATGGELPATRGGSPRPPLDPDWDFDFDDDDEMSARLPRLTALFYDED
ncbi:DUF4240 domain-containing protein [Actinotalea sp. K2]|uniref:DUF4240 domain-containing protein n=1 Tax=Actinotalea sp. K2 TaxID=2939438 RepID=UPI0020181050|nr:DUF4240 domain-containing protein [Actinotalea sp. K2]MCL3860988.1 DUF4240 domain-containing protein [Actinotalea sp. K2]